MLSASDLSIVVLDDLQQGALQHGVDPLGGEEVLRLAQLPEALQQRLGEHQEGGALPQTGALLLLHQLGQPLQLRTQNY